MMIGNAIRMMCRAQKSREGDHFQGAIGLANLLENQVPDIPDFVWDKHTRKGRNLGRGTEHFRTEATKLHPEPKQKDRYEDEFYRLLALKEKRDADPIGHSKAFPRRSLMTRNNDHESEEATSWRDRHHQGEIPF
jgi:hypothetical protein